MTAFATTSTTTAPVPPPPHIGRHVIESPVVLAPMVGITELSVPAGSVRVRFGGPGRRGPPGEQPVCERDGDLASPVERNELTMGSSLHGPEERPRSVQLYSVDPVTAG